MLGFLAAKMVSMTKMALSFVIKELTTSWCLNNHWKEFVDDAEETKQAA